MREKKRLVGPRDVTKKIRVSARRSNAHQTFRKIFFSSVLIVSLASGGAVINHIANRPGKEQVQKEEVEKSEEEATIKRMNGGEYGEIPSERKRLNKDLLKAANKSDAEKVAHLLDIGADVNTKTDFGSSPLMLASGNWWKSDETARLLIEGGADLNAKNSLGLTPLMFASKHGNIRVVRLLLENGADINAVDERGETALDKAVRFDFTKIADLLNNYEKDKKKNFLSF